MKKIFTPIFFICCSNSFAQNVGIGTSDPKAKLHVADSSVLFNIPGNLPATAADPPVSGGGNRFMWYAEKAALRAGGVIFNAWDKNFIGNYSVALGYNNIASTRSAVALGENSEATGNSAIAMGYGAGAYGHQSIAIGQGAKAGGESAFAAGFITEAAGNFSFATGQNNVAKAINAFVAGTNNDIADNPSPTQPSGTDRIFQVGNGEDFVTRSNAITILRNGNTGIGTTTPLTRLHVHDSSVLFSTPGFAQSSQGMAPVHGSGRRMLWFAAKGAFRAGYVLGNLWDTDSIGLNSFATGSTTLAKGQYSFASGVNSKASSFLCIAMGNHSVANADFSTAIGNYAMASGSESISLGPGNTASGRGARGFGYGATASGDFSISLGDGSFSEGMSATATGLATHASGQNSFAAGAYSVASGTNAFAAGSNSTASGLSSFAQGDFAFSTGNMSSAMGWSVFAKAKSATALGQFNDMTDNPSPSSESASDRIFQVGNGTANNARRNALTLLRNGFTGIGTLTPLTTLDIAGRNNWDLSNTEGDFRIGNAAYRIKMGVALDGGGAGAGVIRAMGGINVLALGAGTSNQLLLSGNTGFVGVGVDNPTQKLHVAGNILATGTITPSDFRYKKNIQLIENPIEKIKQINGVTYQYRSETFTQNGFDDKTQVGLIAQEVEAVLPEIVVTDDKGYKAVDYSKMVPLLVEGIKALEKQVEVLKQELKQLRNEK